MATTRRFVGFWGRPYGAFGPKTEAVSPVIGSGCQIDGDDKTRSVTAHAKSRYVTGDDKIRQITGRHC